MYRTVKVDPWFDHQPEKRFLDELTALPEEELTVPPLPDREPWMKTRITRCFFSPINRPPKNGDELSYNSNGSKYHHNARTWAFLLFFLPHQNP